MEDDTDEVLLADAMEELERHQRDFVLAAERDHDARAQAQSFLDILYETHPYNVSTAAHLYRHFDQRKTLDEMEKEHPHGTDWNAQFRFERR
jgi:hypothetical protein